jgi:hypothetical protein
LVNEINDSQPFHEGRGRDYCRGCLGNRLFSALDLGELPIANELLTSPINEFERFPLHLSVCVDCGLGQVADVVTPERIFRDYRYLSSISSTFLKHASDYVEMLLTKKMFDTGDWVLEIASNDGYLLKNFLKFDIPVIGIEPAENVALMSQALGIETIPEFFSTQLAERIFKEYGYPKLIIANNVMAHVPNLIDFIRGLSILCGPKTQISIENPSLANILIGLQFDTIYHEHYSYLSATAVSNLADLNGLQLMEVEELNIHGGSNRYWLRKTSNQSSIHESVNRIRDFESHNGLFAPKDWETFTEKVDEILDGFHVWLQETNKNGGRVYGYGAAAKASTILNSVDVQFGLITSIADASPEKQNRFMPPHAIPIISPRTLLEEKPTDVIIFPWNIKNEIAIQLKKRLGNQTRLWCAIPSMHEVGL